MPWLHLRTEDIDKLNNYLTKEYPGCLFSILDDSSFPQRMI